MGLPGVLDVNVTLEGGLKEKGEDFLISYFQKKETQKAESRKQCKSFSSQQLSSKDFSSCFLIAVFLNTMQMVMIARQVDTTADCSERLKRLTKRLTPLLVLQHFQCVAFLTPCQVLLSS